MAKYKNLIDVGNLNIDNNTLTIDCVNNRVGIGVSNPSAGLEVESDNGIIVSRNGYSQCLQFQPANSGIPTILGLGGSGIHIGPTSATGIRMDSSGNVGVGTTAVAVGYKLTNNGAFFVNAGGGTGITINGAAGGNRILRFHTGDISSNSIRWGLAANATAEGGSDAGSDFGIYRYDDAGTYISDALTIERSTGNVGLNCATPPAALSVSAGNRPDQDAVYIVGTPDDGKSILCIRSNHTSGTTKNLIHVARSGKEGLFVVNNSEAVGIGTTTPSKKLEISNARTETNFGTNANSMFSLENDDTTVNNFASMQFHDGSGLGSAYIGARFLRTNKGGDLFFGTRNDATGGAYIRMTINDAGLVGIANENPSYTLDVTGNINFTGNLTLNGSVYGGASGFWTSNVNDIYYTAGGIAIGTSAPYAAKVTIVNDTSTAYANVTPSIANFAQVMVNNCDHVSGGTFAGLQFNLTGNSQNRISYIGSITEGSGNRFASLVFGADDGGTRAEMMRINSDGNIGVGTNNITDHASFSRALVVNGPSGGAIYVKDNDSSTDVGVFGQANTCTYIENLAVGPIRFYTCNGTDFSERMRITSSGTLAVGTEAPASQALLKADFAGDLLLSTGTTSTLYLQDTTNWVQLISGDMRFGLSSAEKMRITSDSRLGIGTTPDADAGLHVDTTSFTGASGGIFMEDARTDANPWIAVKNDVQQWQIQTAGARSDNFEIWDTTSAATRLAIDTSGNVGIGANNTQPAYKLDVSGTIYGENLLSRNTYINKSYSSNYNFSLYPELADGNIRPEVLEYSSANSANVTYGNTNESDAPYAEYFATDGNLTLCGGKIPVCAGESIYGEVWVKRASGATGTAGDLYFGVVREDKDCNPISTNAGIIYFVSAEAIPTDGVWHKYSGTLTLPTSHTPFNGSDGGPVRYIEPHLLVNYSAGTIPTCVSNIVVRKTNINSDCGPTINLGHLSLIEDCSNTNQYSTGSYDNIRISNIDQTTDNWAGISFQDGLTEAASAVIQTRFKDHTNNYGELHFSTRGSSGLSSNMVIDQYGNLGIGTSSPTTFTDYTTLHHKNAAGDVVQLAENDNGVIYQIIASGTGTVLIGSRSNHDLMIGTNDDEKVRITTNGNVGVGVINPAATLHVEYQTETPLAIFDEMLLTSTNAAQGAFGSQRWGWYGTAWARNASSCAAGWGSGFTGGIGDFGVHTVNDTCADNTDMNSTNLRFVVKNDGKVGIGTSAPQTILHAKSSSGIGKIRLEDDGGRAVELQSPSSGVDNGRIGTITNHDFEINAGNGNGTNSIVFLTDGNEQARIDNSGGIGIGLSSTANGTSPSLLIASTNSSSDNHSHCFYGPAAGTNDQVLFCLNRGGGAYGRFTIEFNTAKRFFVPGEVLADGGFGAGNIALNSKCQNILIGCGKNSIPASLFCSNSNLGAGEWNYPVSALAPSQAANSQIVNMVGIELASYNAAFIGLKYCGDNSSANYMFLGMYSADAIIAGMSNGDVGIGTHFGKVTGTLPPDGCFGRLTVYGETASEGDFNSYPGHTSVTGIPTPKECKPDLMVCRDFTYSSPPPGGTNNLRGQIAIGLGVGIYSVNPNVGGSSYYGDIRFYTSCWDAGYCTVDRMTITCAGEVCAHKTLITPKLEVNGDIYQNGDTFYETNSFTPTIVASTSNPTVGYSVQYGRYTRIGNLVTVQIKIDISSISGGSGQLRIGGLPFTSNTDGNYRSAGISSFTRGLNNGGGAITLNIGPNTTEAGLYRWTDSSNFDTELTPADVSSVPATIHASLTYEADSWT